MDAPEEFNPYAAPKAVPGPVETKSVPGRGWGCCLWGLLGACLVQFAAVMSKWKVGNPYFASLLALIGAGLIGFSPFAKHVPAFLSRGDESQRTPH